MKNRIELVLLFYLATTGMLMDTYVEQKELHGS